MVLAKLGISEGSYAAWLGSQALLLQIVGTKHLQLLLLALSHKILAQ